MSVHEASSVIGIVTEGVQGAPALRLFVALTKGSVLLGPLAGLTVLGLSVAAHLLAVSGRGPSWLVAPMIDTAIGSYWVSQLLVFLVLGGGVVGSITYVIRNLERGLGRSDELVDQLARRIEEARWAREEQARIERRLRDAQRAGAVGLKVLPASLAARNRNSQSLPACLASTCPSQL